jgi:hypothetical protein
MMRIPPAADAAHAHKVDIAEHRPLEVLVASHRPRRRCSRVTSDRRGHLAC